MVATCRVLVYMSAPWQQQNKKNKKNNVYRHVEDPVGHVRVWWIMEARRHVKNSRAVSNNNNSMLIAF